MFAAVALGLAVYTFFPQIPEAVAISASLVGVLVAVTRSGWIALFMGGLLVGDLSILPAAVRDHPAGLARGHRPARDGRQGAHAELDGSPHRGPRLTGFRRRIADVLVAGALVRRSSPLRCPRRIQDGCTATFGDGAAGGGWVDAGQPVFVVMDLCVFEDMSAIDAFGLLYHQQGTIRGADLATKMRYRPGNELPAIFGN